MTNLIHETAIVSPKAKIGNDVKIGPWCIIGDDVELADRVNLISNVMIDGKTFIDEDTIVYPFAVIGVMSQDLKFQDSESMTGVRIGKRNRIREYVTIHSGTPASKGTKIGDDNQIMVNAHVAHDCILGNHIILSNLVQLAGHVEVEDYAIVSGMTAVHQFCKIGKHCIIGGCSGVGNDILPYSISAGNVARYHSINRVGLTRRGFTNEDIHAIYKVYTTVFDKKREDAISERLKELKHTVGKNQYAMDAIDFIENRSTRGVTDQESKR